MNVNTDHKAAAPIVYVAKIPDNLLRLVSGSSIPSSSLQKRSTNNEPSCLCRTRNEPIILFLGVISAMAFNAPPSGLRQLGDKAIEQRNFDLAVSLYTQAISVDPKDAIAYSHRSVAYLSCYCYQDALRDAEKVSVNPFCHSHFLYIQFCVLCTGSRTGRELA
jgi:hypothetical protein